MRDPLPSKASRTAIDAASDGNAAKIRIILVDEHTILREGLALLLGSEPDMHVIAQGREGRDAVELYGRHKPDVAILDMRLPNLSGVEASAEILRADPYARLLILTAAEGEIDVQRSMEAGAKGYLLKNSEREDVLRGIRCVNRGERYLTPSIGGKLANVLKAQPLSLRERSVLFLLAQGKANKVIASELGIADGTVKAHINSLCQKLKVSSRTEAALAAVRSGLVAI